MNNDKRKQGILCLLVTALLWSVGGVLIKGVTWNSMAISGIRSLIAALTIACFMGKPSFKWTTARIGAVISYAATVLLFVVATKETTAANAVLLQYTAPIYTALLGLWLLKEPVHKKDVLAIGVILGGMLLFFIDSIKVGSLFGNTLALLSGVSFGSMHVFMRMEKDNDPMQSAFWGNILAFVVAVPFMGDITFTTGNVVSILMLGIFQMGFAYILYSKAIKHVSALEAVLIPIIEPLLNPVWVFIIQGETPSMYAIVGGIIVVGGVTLRSLSNKLEVG